MHYYSFSVLIFADVDAESLIVRFVNSDLLILVTSFIAVVNALFHFIFHFTIFNCSTPMSSYLVS